MLEIVLHFTVKSLRLMKMGREKKCTDREKMKSIHLFFALRHAIKYTRLPCNIAENSEASNSQTSIAF